MVESQLEQVDELLSLYAELKRGPQSAEAIQRFAVVTLRQSYGYEEFIECIRARSMDFPLYIQTLFPSYGCENFLRIYSRSEWYPSALCG